jgi:hypothetical protein
MFLSGNHSRYQPTAFDSHIKKSRRQHKLSKPELIINLVFVNGNFFTNFLEKFSQHGPLPFEKSARSHALIAPTGQVRIQT